MADLYAEPEKRMKKGEMIVQKYQEYLAERDKVSNTVERISEAWTGADSTGYVTQIRSYDADFKKLGEVIDKLGQVLRRQGARLANTRDNLTNISKKL